MKHHAITSMTPLTTAMFIEVAASTILALVYSDGWIAGYLIMLS